MKTTAKTSKKKKIGIAIGSVGIIGAIVATVVTLAANSKEIRSFEYIEKLKAKYEFQPLQILEIAPSKSESQFGYLVEGCEPCGDWKEIASMYENKREREMYIKTLFQNLERANLLSAVPDAAPLLKTADYTEAYPWARTSQTDDQMKLQFAETVSTKGEMIKVDNQAGEYNANFSYSLEANNFSNCFNFIDFKNNAIAKLHLTKLNVGKGIRNDASKVFALDLTNKSIVVFGSTEQNWKDYGDCDYYYDLASVYKSKNYYTLDGIEKGKTYCLSFETTVTGGKGQVTIIPLDRTGNPIYYSPNYSNQYWYWSQYFTSSGEGNPYSYQFTIPRNSNVHKVQVRFDVSDTESAAVFKNISVYEYKEEGSLFKIGGTNGFQSHSAGTTVDTTKETVTVTASAGATVIDTYPSGNPGTRWVVDRPLANLYTLTYHVENSGGKSKVVIYGLNSSNAVVQTAEQEQNASGTYELNIRANSDVKKFGIAFGAIAGGKQQKVVYSNISLTAYQEFVGSVKATHIQVYDHFYTGVPESTLSEENCFDYDRWYVSGSSVKKESEKPGEVIAYEDGVFMVRSGSYEKVSTNYSDTRFVASNMLYYIPVNGNTEYQLSFRVVSDEDVTYGIYFSNEDRNNIKVAGRTYPATVKVKDEGTISSDLDGEQFFRTTFKTPGSARYVQISFGVTKKNQQATFDYIGLYEMVRAKAFYYNLKFTPKSVASLNPNEDAGLALYALADYKLAGIKGDPEFTMDPGKTYYYIENTNGRYVTAPASIADGTPLYERGKYYVWQGNYGEGDFYVDKNMEYFTAEINYDGYVEATAENVSMGSVLFRLSDDGSSYILEDTYSGGPIPEGMYVRSTPVSDSPDALHPYFLPEEEFREAKDDEIPLFIANLNYYVYVGVGGEYNYQSGSDELVIQTDTIFYSGGFKNNNWFKRFVLDCERETPEATQEQLDKVKVNVVVLTPAALNLLEYSDTNPENSELVTAVGSYELAVISEGFDLSRNKPAAFESDLSDDVLNVLTKRLLMDNRSDKEYMPVAIDLEMLDIKSKPNFKALAQAICTDTRSDNTTFVNEEPGLGSNDYIYRFDGTDIPTSVNFIVNNQMLSNFSEDKYIIEDAPYSKAYKLIRQENLIRRNGKKYQELPEEVDEAIVIRHILNYRGRRVLLNKETVNILEIEPMTTASVLYTKEEEKSDTRLIDVRRWFATDVTVYDSYAKDPGVAEMSQSEKNEYLNEKRALRYTYYDDNGTPKDGITNFVITTMSPHEVAGKIDDLAEHYDLVYVGTSLEGFDKLLTYCASDQEASSLSGQSHADNMSFVYRNEDRLDHGDVVPNYNDDTQDGFYYSSTGDKFETEGDGIFARSRVAGMLRDDYTVVGNTIGSWFGVDSSNLPWYVDSSSATLRDSGNDITDTKMEELKVFIEQGLPVIVGDNICLQDYDGNLKVKILGKTYYQRAGRDVYLPGHEGDDKFKFTAADNEIHVCLCAEIAGDLPNGIKVGECTWYHDGIEIPTEVSKKLLFPRLREWLGLPTTQEYNNQDYRKIDTDGDGICDLFCFDFVPGDKKEDGSILCPEDGYYYCKVNFDFSECRSALGATLRYNGLYGETNDADIFSNKIHVFQEDRVYNIHYLDYTDNLVYRVKYNDIINAFEYKPDHTKYKTLSIHQMFLVTEPIPEDANDNVLYRAIATHHWSYSWREVTCEWLNAGDENLTFDPGDKVVTYKERIDGSMVYWHSVYYDTYMRVYRDHDISERGAEIVCYSNEDGDSMINKGFCCYFNDEGNEARASRVSAGGYGTFNWQYTGNDDRTFTVHGYKLALLDANDEVVPMAQGYKAADGGYTLTGKDQYGNDVYGETSNIKTNAKIFDKRIDNCSNLYDVLSSTLGNEDIQNVFTENQIERQSGAYREILIQYVNFSEPIVNVLSKADEYPEHDSLTNNAISMSFQITNDTDEDTVNARYNCQFFIDENGDGQFSPIEEAQATITGSTDNGAGGLRTTSKASGTHTYTLYYKFGKEETGFKPCRLKISKVGQEGAHGSYYFNVFVAPQKRPDGTDDHEIIEAIQILPGDWDPWYASLNKNPDGYNTGNIFVGEHNVKPYSDNQWKGSVFLSDVFVRSELTDINSDVTVDNGKWDKGTKMERTIYYKDGTHDETNTKYRYDESKIPDYVNFKITSASGIVYLEINIHFTNIHDVDDAYNTDDGGSKVAELDLESYDLLFMGYGDSYGKLGLGKVAGAVGTVETLGYNQNASLAIERMIDDGIPVIFCHDTLLPNVNFINYWLNDIASWGNSAANSIVNGWNNLWNSIGNWFSGGSNSNSSYVKYNNEIHTSRIKNGYYANLILRDPLGQDRYGISYKIKERCGYVYNDKDLKRGHDYNNIYENTRNNEGTQQNGGFWYYDENNNATNKSQVNFDKNGNALDIGYNEWKAIYRSLKTADEKDRFAQLQRSKGAQAIISYNILMMEEKGYCISWVPGSDKKTTDCFVHGYTSYTVHRFARGTGDTSATNSVTQVNRGKMTTYPYYINDDMEYNSSTGSYGDNQIKMAHAFLENGMLHGRYEIMKTHEQYFQVNINRDSNGEGATVWYCLAPGTGNYSDKFSEVLRNDCENAYFIYTKGNVTYTGAGHSNEFSVFEAKMFLCAIASAQRTEAKAPKVSFYEPEFGEEMTTYTPVAYGTLVREINKGAVNGTDVYVDSATNVAIWKQTLYFKLANTSASLDNAEYRKIGIFLEKDDISDSVTVYDDGGNAVDKSQIKAGVYYHFDLPDSAYKKFVDNNVAVADVYIRVYDDSIAEYVKVNDNGSIYFDDIVVDGNTQKRGYIMSKNDEGALVTRYYIIQDGTDENGEPIYVVIDLNGNKVNYYDRDNYMTVLVDESGNVVASGEATGGFTSASMTLTIPELFSLA